MNPVDSLIKFSGFEGWAVIPVVGLLLWIYFQYLKVKYAGYLRATGKRLDQVLVSKGDRGEFRIYHELVKHRMPGEILLNVYLPKPDGETTEVDLIHLTTHGIFVIESKNYSGWIYGSEHQWNWTQTFRNGHKEKFFNPIKQNHGHVLALLEITQLSIEVFRPLVVFGAKATLKKITVNSSDYPVITIHQLIKEIKNQLSTGPELLPPGQISELKIKLEQFCRADEQTRQRHIEQIKQKTDAKA